MLITHHHMYTLSLRSIHHIWSCLSSDFCVRVRGVDTIYGIQITYDLWSTIWSLECRYDMICGVHFIHHLWSSLKSDFFSTPLRATRSLLLHHTYIRHDLSYNLRYGRHLLLLVPLCVEGGGGEYRSWGFSVGCVCVFFRWFTNRIPWDPLICSPSDPPRTQASERKQIVCCSSGVGCIGDNTSGGMMQYRVSKASWIWPSRRLQSQANKTVCGCVYVCMYIYTYYIYI